MGVFGKLFGGSNKALPEATAAPVADKSARTIGYVPELMESLLNDHRQLTASYARVGKLLQEDRFDDARDELINFKTRLHAHILSENVRFYTYLEQSLQGDKNNLDTLHDFRREMNIIARDIMGFVRRYQSSEALSSKARFDFANDYDAAGKLLAYRLQQEESKLYPLYQPS